MQRFQNDPAFPHPKLPELPPLATQTKNLHGLTVREWYAGQAIAGLCAATDNIDHVKPERIASIAKAIADKMLE